MKALSQTPRSLAYALAATIVILQWLGAPVAHAGDRSKPYLTADAHGPVPASDRSAPDLSAPAQPASNDTGTEQLEKLLLHAALADSSAFGLLQALQQPAKPVLTLMPLAPVAKPVSVECHETSRRKT
ncbi:MAG TPA: hypothetical protein VGN07_03720 [Steroidobacteraceae bacterium]|jgi:hypothetical protein